MVRSIHNKKLESVISINESRKALKQSSVAILVPLLLFVLQNVVTRHRMLGLSRLQDPVYRPAQTQVTVF